MAEEKEKSDPARLRKYTLLSLGAGMSVIAIFSAQNASIGAFLGRFGASVALAMGAVMVGTLLGFLFGIPRTQQQGAIEQRDPNAGNGRDIAYQINTNLEQISDWLTKIIIGVGLIELRSIGAWLLAFSSDVGAGFQLDGVLARTYVMGLLLYFAICGFLLSYLWTRLFFGIAVRAADEGLVGRIEKWEADARADARAIALATRQLYSSHGEAGPSQAELEAAVVQASSHTRVKIFYDALATRRDAERRHLAIPVFKALIASDKAGIYHQNHAQLAFALKDKAEPEWGEAERELTRAIETRDRMNEEGFGEYEFNRAICRISLNGDTAQIQADLRKAAADPWVRRWSLRQAKAWLDANGVTAKSLGFEAD